MYCTYYQAKVARTKTWFVVAVLRSFEHMAFDRTLNADECIFEFFVPDSMEPYFLQVMHYFEGEGLISDMKKLPNRLLTEQLY